jgi:chemotaxis protein histidine kinase CheA
MTQEDLDTTIAEELRSNRQDPGAWMWAVSNSGGDQGKARELYRQRRLEQTAKDVEGRRAKELELRDLRSGIRRGLALRNRTSIYAALGLLPDTSDLAIAEAIRNLAAQGTPPDPETRYAIEVLGSPAERERYDRSLHSQLLGLPAADVPAPAFGPEPGRSRATTWATAGLLILAGTYTAIEYKKSADEKELRRQEIAQKAALAERQIKLDERQAELKAAMLEAAAEEKRRLDEARDLERLAAVARQDISRLQNDLQREQQKQDQVQLTEERKRKAEIAAAEAAQRRSDAAAIAKTRALRQQMINEALANGNPEQARRLRTQQTLY